MKELKTTNHLFKSIKELIEEARAKVAVTVNSSLTLMYWHIGKQIDEEILRSERAEYGKEIVVTLSKQLTEEYGRGYSKRNLLNMVKFFKVFNDEAIVQTMSAQLSWSHFNELVVIEDELKREFYIEMCKLDNWSVRVLQNRIDSMLYERTALSKEPDKQIELLELDRSNIHVAQYLTVLPAREKLEAKLHSAVISAKEKYKK